MIDFFEITMQPPPGRCAIRLVRPSLVIRVSNSFGYAKISRREIKAPNLPQVRQWQVQFPSSLIICESAAV